MSVSRHPLFVFRSRALILAIPVLLAACTNDAALIDPANVQQVAEGATLYERHCAACHGVNLEGQTDWRKRKPDGKLPAPPHDASGHTWHHPDQVLFDITKHGMVPPHAPANYPSDMPAWGNVLSDADIRAVLSYIQSRWPAEALKIQNEIDADYRRMNP